MVTIVRKFSVTLEGSPDPLPVLFVQQNPANYRLTYCVVSAKGEQLFIDSEKVTSIKADD